MSDIAIKAENISKAYQLGDFNTGALTKDIERWWALMRGKEDPFLKIGEANDRATKGTSDVVWSLKDINFEIKQGDAVGIIGRNGAGKSTLLKVLSRVTSPTTGNIKVKGRIASLLEVGTGFHPELTGGENIYLNGAIMGMTKREIKRKFDEIVDFAGVERYIDTPVKRYSSGMYVRLAFAVAAYLESEILIVDEVLAVGDAEFQKKCLGKMGEVSKGQGRSVLFVSHNMGSIATLCNNSIVLKNGIVDFTGDITKGVDHYMRQNKGEMSAGIYINKSTKNTDILSVKTINEKTKQLTQSFRFDDLVTLEFAVVIEPKYHSVFLGMRVIDQRDRNVFTSQFKIDVNNKNKEEYKIRCEIPAGILVPGTYSPIIAMHIPNVEVLSFLENSLSFNIEETGSNFSQYQGEDYGCVFVDCRWSNNN